MCFNTMNGTTMQLVHLVGHFLYDAYTIIAITRRTSVQNIAVIQLDVASGSLKSSVIGSNSAI